MTPKINLSLLKTAIAEDTKRLREMKKELRAPGYKMTTRDATMLMSAKKNATIHCAIAAHARGKIHLTRWRPKEGEELRPMTREEQAKLIEKYLPPYLLPEPETQPAPEVQADKSAA